MQFMRFCLVGLVNTAVGLLIMEILHLLGLNYWVTTLIGNGLGIGLSFVLNKRFTFDDKKGWKKFIPFLLVCLVSYLISYLPIYFAFSRSQFLKPYFSFSFVVGAGFYTMTNFLGQKYITFQQKGLIN
jgi:putative flippase GtrA